MSGPLTGSGTARPSAQKSEAQKVTASEPETVARSATGLAVWMGRELEDSTAIASVSGKWSAADRPFRRRHKTCHRMAPSRS